MLHALARGETNPERLADMAKMQLRKKLTALQLALDGHLLPHHRFLLSEMLDELNREQYRPTGSRDRAANAALSESSASMDEYARHQTSRCLDTGRKDRS